MAEILVKVPRTTNGINPLIGENGLPVYKEVTLPVYAKKLIERMNEKLPQHLRRIVTDVVPEPVAATPEPPKALVPEATPEPPKQTTKP